MTISLKAPTMVRESMIYSSPLKTLQPIMFSDTKGMKIISTKKPLFSGVNIEVSFAKVSVLTF
jgi:hypothetical protein